MAAVVRASLFLSWAHGDRSAKEALLAALPLAALGGVELTRWEDSDLLLGTDWEAAIRARLASSDYGLLLLSPQFLASEYIQTVELPDLLRRDRVLPILLRQVPLDGTFDLRGLASRQIFTGEGGRAFTQTAGPGRERFALRLAGEIRRRILADAT